MEEIIFPSRVPIQTGNSITKDALGVEILIGASECAVLRRFWELVEYHGRTLPLPLAFEVCAELGVEKAEAKSLLHRLEMAGYLRLNWLRSVTLVARASDMIGME